MTQVSAQISNSSAIPAWSGFVYQGKIAFYHAIGLLAGGDRNAHSLKVETLDDFVVHDINGAVLSLHQVKTMQSAYRSAYEKALIQAAKVNTQDCSNDTNRWFHVSTKLDDFSDREADISAGEYHVQFYSYEGGVKYVETGTVDEKLNEVVTLYLESNNLNITEILIEHKLAKLQMLLAARVNLAHHRNQHEKIRKFEAANSIPIYFTEIEECLKDEVIHDDDYEAILYKFRKALLERTDELLRFNQNDPSIDLNDLYKCRFVIANMDIERLTKLYFSKVPNQTDIALNGFSTTTVEMYLGIVSEIQGIRTENDLPHYYQSQAGTFLPTAMQFKRINQQINIDEIQGNIVGIRKNQVVQDVLYDYENLIVEMDISPFRLSDKSTNVGKFTDISEGDEKRITKINNVRFVSVRNARDEIND
ncbi:ABC-three component system protein [Shewanella surugensis]|uniref:ABC-three component systems C-terminal domain-containing protein n=1 Tax=Shewanella surugensis TaxID=212020 RepID=A0ABT0LEZ3_9GAMM|nr:ABC-three component system protein [Shewanella surugensis]MCL1126273.1 hypothetical protein [Shewanella surugensis]